MRRRTARRQRPTTGGAAVGCGRAEPQRLARVPIALFPCRPARLGHRAGAEARPARQPAVHRWRAPSSLCQPEGLSSAPRRGVRWPVMWLKGVQECGQPANWLASHRPGLHLVPLPLPLPHTSSLIPQCPMLCPLSPSLLLLSICYSSAQRLAGPAGVSQPGTPARRTTTALGAGGGRAAELPGGPGGGTRPASQAGPHTRLG